MNKRILGRTLAMIGIVTISLDLVAFDSYEHIASGSTGVKLKFPSGHQNYDDFPYKAYYDILLDPRTHKEVSTKIGKIEYAPQYLLVRDRGNTLKLGYGEIIALAGDFIGSTESTISNSIPLRDFEKMRPQLESNFMKNFKNLLPYDDNPVYKNNNLDYLRGLFKNEYKNLVLSLDKKHGVHFYMASSHSVTCKIKDQYAYGKSPGYIALLANNLDHFQDDARVSYAIGHTLALEKAKLAGEQNNSGEREKALETLNLAYAMDAFASHFLTDLFSAGHLRTPRGPLLGISRSIMSQIQGYTVLNVGFMANAMHDEDNYIGLWLRNEHGSTWKSYGDGAYFDIKSQDNRDAIQDALQASVDEVYQAFATGALAKFKNFRALKLVGEAYEPGADFVNKLVNPYPLFRIAKGWPVVRKDYYDNGIGDFQPVTSMTGLSAFIKNDQGTYNHGSFLSFLNEATLVDALKRDAFVDCYNTYNRESYLPSFPADYVTLGNKVNVIAVDNQELQFYKSILHGNLRPDGTFYVVNEDTGDRILKQCDHAMETNFKLGEVKSASVIEVRGRIDRGYSHPVVIVDKDGNLRRMRGYKTPTAPAKTK